MTLSDALNHDEKSISVNIEKEERLFEQVWLIGGLLLCGAMFLVLLSRHYWQRKIKALEEEHRKEAERQGIGDELNMAKGIQAAMLPSVFPAFPDREEFDLYASMTPAQALERVNVQLADQNQSMLSLNYYGAQDKG